MYIANLLFGNRICLSGEPGASSVPTLLGAKNPRDFVSIENIIQTKSILVHNNGATLNCSAIILIVAIRQKNLIHSMHNWVIIIKILLQGWVHVLNL